MSSCCSIVLADVDRQRRCLDSTPAIRRETRACATRPIHPRSTKSSLSCARQGIVRTAAGFAAWSSSCDTQGYAFRKRSRSQKPIVRTRLLWPPPFT
jgi:hypothetical protein